MILWRFFLLLSFCISTISAKVNLRIENSNFLLSQASYFPVDNKRYTIDYNRFRIYADWAKENYFAKGIADAVSYLGKDFVASRSFDSLSDIKADTPFITRTNINKFSYGAVYAKLYRLYTGYDNGNTRVVAGLQNINIGVGHIWTPSNLFNPKNTYALEPDETYPVLAFYASHYIGEKSQFYGAVAKRKNMNLKYLGGFSYSFGTSDLSLNIIKTKQTTMFGYSIEGDFGDTGIALRSEGAYIKNNLNNVLIDTSTKKTTFYQGLIGADYAFENGLNLTIEGFYSSKTFKYTDVIINLNNDISTNMALSHFYLGSMLSYDINSYLSSSLLYIESFNTNNSHFISPVFTYTINDNNQLSAGALINAGSQTSEFGMFASSYYLKYILSF